ncbi:hypothetical protein SSX86_026487 [Deinandra increscens subsp. villosa]|uniref:Malectin-like domain-containing protein n=1 Tax=Deinandra increscens subsp. villosa TaxID=3103831 RepID=A0AAP0CLG3_9ASTR
MVGPFKLLPVLLLALFTFSVSGELIASIDCGGTEIQTDTNLIIWSPDDDTVISNGQAYVTRTDSKSPIMNTLRAFTTRKKNCYSYPVTQREQVLVRVSFYYGNYDGLSKPPTFDLHFDGNFWATVETSISEVITYEAIYIVKRDSVSVCVAQTKPDQVPFISALEIRGVDSDFYDDVSASRAVFLNSRFSCGASDTLRYAFPDDAYDRIWVPAKCGTKSVASDAIFIDTTGPNKPPLGVLQYAGTVDTTSEALFLGPVSAMNYIIMYFSDVTDVTSTSQTRSFRIYESKTVGSGPIQSVISPPYGSVEVRNLTYFTLDSATNVSLAATVGSDLPPLLNAIESFDISEILTNGTDNNDVDALALLQTTFDVLQGWRGDPCLPAPYSWDWLNCSTDATPRVTALHLDGYNLSGLLPDISSMDALQIIDMHKNSLTGTIPSFLGTMPNLQQLNLADNQLSGSIPTALSKNNKVKLTVTGNPSLCAPGKSCPSSPGTINATPGSTTTTNSKKSSSLPVILGTTIPAFFLVWVAAGIFIILRKRGKPANTNIPTNGANGHSGGGANGLHKIGEGMVHEFMENVAQQTFGSPSPLFGNTGGESSDQYGETGNQVP